MSKKYGATKFSDFIDMLMEEGIIFTYAEMHKLISDRMNILIQNINLEQAEIKRREKEAQEELNKDRIDLEKFSTDLNHRRTFVNKEINKVLEIIDRKINPDMSIYEIRQIIKSEVR